MKFTIAILLLGSLLGSVASCNLASCSLTGALTGTAGCTSYKDYLDCLSAQSGSCTSGTSDLVQKGLIDAAITSNTAIRALLGCSGASLASISSMALILSVVVTLIKTHF
ncbi:uncharacterized protein LOC124279754 isoform X1 [Haliotis rubra]|uniref:uncharacterized protein LOC124279754 isoform X1 n=1 Tax=Haliotis rubra TaxID=36100 RepID=UPI001EE50E33|nr:uncharacterized protein LOC124279754 isoform X1 [Haliotis rubra]